MRRVRGNLRSEIRNLKLDSGEPRVHRDVVMATDTRKGDEIQERLIKFGARVSRVAKKLPLTMEGHYIAQQILRSGLAAAPNYAEARAAESRADFIHKLRIVLKELNETHSWLRQIVANGLFSRDKMELIIAENQELRWILAASLKTARRTSPI